ncbi:hypothetical protein JCM8547_005883 [Rhodosporidiobolus lusitaniae]
MKLGTLLALSSTLLIWTPALVHAQIDYGGARRPAPHAHFAAADSTSHRRHHSKVASNVVEAISSKAAKAADAVTRAVKRAGGVGVEQNNEEEGDKHSASSTTPPKAYGTPPRGWPVENYQEPIVSNTTSTPTSTSTSTSSGFASSSTSRRLPSGPSYEGPVSGEDGKDTSDLKKRQTQKTGWSLKGLKKNGVAFGFLPDDGSGGGQTETIEMIESKLGVKAAAQGWYAQVLPEKPFDGAQFEARKDQIRNSDGVFQATVMPVTWKGFTWEDNSQAINVANYLQKWVDVGKEVWLRFAHEVNYYQKDGTYQGDVNDFKLGWAVMAKARNDLAPNVKMWFTPNFGDLYEYDKFYPDDPNTVDLIGIDWYPHQLDNFDFANGPADMKKFHDKYTNDRVKFAIGEIGLGIAAPMKSRYEWVKNVLGAKKVMPNMIAVSWFNVCPYWKDNYSYKLVDDDEDHIVVKFFKEG